MEWAAVSANLLHVVSGQIKAPKVRVKKHDASPAFPGLRKTRLTTIHLYLRSCGE